MAPGSPQPVRFAWHAAWGKDKETEKVTTERSRQRENTHFPRLFTWSSIWGGLFVLIFLQEQGFWSAILISGWYSAGSPLHIPLLSSPHTPTFLLFLPSQYSGEKQTWATWANLTAESPLSKACGQTWWNKMLLLFHINSNSLNHLLNGFRLIIK